MIGWYYLHTNGSLVYKTDFPGTAADIRESPFAVDMWPIDTENRETGWSFLVEALASGVNREQIERLADKWKCNDRDADVYAKVMGIEFEFDTNSKQWRSFCRRHYKVGGIGNTKLDSMGDLCKKLGYRRAKTWGPTFKSLLEAQKGLKEGIL